MVYVQDAGGWYEKRFTFTYRSPVAIGKVDNSNIVFDFRFFTSQLFLLKILSCLVPDQFLWKITFIQGIRKKSNCFVATKNKELFFEAREKNLPAKMWPPSSRGGGLNDFFCGFPYRIIHCYFFLSGPAHMLVRLRFCIQAVSYRSICKHEISPLSPLPSPFLNKDKLSIRKEEI